MSLTNIIGGLLCILGAVWLWFYSEADHSGLMALLCVVLVLFGLGWIGHTEHR